MPQTLKKIATVAACICIILLFSSTVSAKIGRDLRVKQISLKEGLSQASVYSIVQDNKGYLWFGTEVGLDRYDGYNFINYTHDPKDPASLTHNRILTMMLDSKGRIWIGTQNGISILDPETMRFTNLLHDPNNPNTISNNDIVHFTEGHDGIIWAGSQNNGINRIDPITLTVHRYEYKAESDKKITALLTDSRGHIWIGTNSGITIHNPKSDEIIHLHKNPKDDNSLIDNRVSSLYEDSNGYFWIGTNAGLYKYNLENNTFTRFIHNPSNSDSLSDDSINALHEYPKGTLWIGTTNHGLNKLEISTSKITRYPSDPDDINSIGSSTVNIVSTGASGNLWIEVRAAGLNKINLSQQSFTHLRHISSEPQSLHNNVIWSLYKSKSRIVWIGTNDGVILYDTNKDHYSLFDFSPLGQKEKQKPRVFRIIEDSLANIWMASDNGVIRYTPSTKIFKHLKPN